MSSDTMRGRVEGSRVKLWVLLNANRWVIAGALALSVFASLVVLGTVDPWPLGTVVRSGDPILYAFQASITALITGVTLVVSINQLVLSQELGPLGDQRQRMSDAMDFRADVEDMLDATSPPEPASFLQMLIDTNREHAEALVDAVADNDDADLRERVEQFADDLTENANEVIESLDDAQFGTYEVVGAALNYNYSWKIYELRRIRDEHEDSLDSDERAAFSEMERSITFFGPAREHIKTLYFQWELVNLSRAIMYAAIPALIVAYAAVLFLDAPAFTSEILGIDEIVWIVSAASTVVVFPFLLLISFVLRIATIAKRTHAIGPFILRESDRSEEIDW